MDALLCGGPLNGQRVALRDGRVWAAVDRLEEPDVESFEEMDTRYRTYGHLEPLLYRYYYVGWHDDQEAWYAYGQTA